MFPITLQRKVIYNFLGAFEQSNGIFCLCWKASQETYLLAVSLVQSLDRLVCCAYVWTCPQPQAAPLILQVFALVSFFLLIALSLNLQKADSTSSFVSQLKCQLLLMASPKFLHLTKVTILVTLTLYCLESLHLINYLLIQQKFFNTYSGAGAIERSEGHAAVKGDEFLLSQNLHLEIPFSLFAYFILYFYKNVSSMRAETLSFLFSIIQWISRSMPINRCLLLNTFTQKCLKLFRYLYLTDLTESNVVQSLFKTLKVP